MPLCRPLNPNPSLMPYQGISMCAQTWAFRHEQYQSMRSRKYGRSISGSHYSHRASIKLAAVKIRPLERVEASLEAAPVWLGAALPVVLLPPLDDGVALVVRPEVVDLAEVVELLEFWDSAVALACWMLACDGVEASLSPCA